MIAKSPGVVGKTGLQSRLTFNKAANSIVKQYQWGLMFDKETLF
jgi:hypothetical protein